MTHDRWVLATKEDSMRDQRLTYGLVALLGSGALVCALGATAYASGGYGPPSQASGTAPGGFTQVILNEAVPSGGGTLTATSGGSSFSVQVPAADAGSGVTLAVTAPSNLAQADNAILGFGVALGVDGAGVSGTFAAPITVTVTNPVIKAGEQVDYWTGSAWAPYANATVGNGSLTVTIDSDPQFALVSASTTTPIPSSTSPHTGVPIDGLLAAASVALFGAGLATSRAMRLRRRDA